MASSEAADPRTCQIAKDNLHALETTEMIRSRGADGEYYYLNDEEKQLQVERASALIRVHCRDGGEGDAK
ncbi:hypothetical protein [Congregibacter sp.]|uniref:hypothetical protein n=1 Tax=Congregibacter sp. TaxID=2744308 RepID=UPI003F6AC74D